jgi:hypothetical protein
VLQKRFNEFNEIYRALKSAHPTVAAFKFPSKTLNFNKDAAALKEMRRERFNEFMGVRALRREGARARAAVDPTLIDAQEISLSSSFVRIPSVVHSYLLSCVGVVRGWRRQFISTNRRS